MGRGLDGFFFRSKSIPLLASCAALKVRERGGCPRAPLAAPVSQNSGGYCVGETPLPIPNREVKPYSADGTWPSRAWESRSPPVVF